MEYAKIENFKIVKWYSEKPKGGIGHYATISEDMPDNDLIALGVLPVVRQEMPEIHKFQRIEENVSIEDSRVYISYSIINDSIDKKIEALARARRSYQEKYVEGTASAPLWDGYKMGLPKCMALTAWAQTLGAEYNTRKVAITEDSDVDLDFSMFPPPYSVWEALDEVTAALTGA